jgi:hypothetical protein
VNVRALWTYAVSLFGCYLLFKASQEHPINPLTIGAIMPMVLVGPATTGDRLIRRLQAAGRALTQDPAEENGQEAPS